MMPTKVPILDAMPSHPRRDYAPTIAKNAILKHTLLVDDWSERPLAGRDLDTFRHRWHLTTPEFYVAFGIANQFKAAALLRSSEVVPYELEMLARLYTLNPGPAPWVPWAPPEAFAAIYEEALWDFDGCAEETAFARGKFATRFAAAFDRSHSTSYRWLDKGEDVSKPIAIFLRKLRDMESRMHVLEELARKVHEVRGGDFDMRAPLPVPGERALTRGRRTKLDRALGLSPTEAPLRLRKPITL